MLQEIPAIGSRYDFLQMPTSVTGSQVHTKRQQNTQESVMAGVMEKSRLHPLVGAAAVAVILVSVTGVAALMGWIPGSRGQHVAGEPSAPVAASGAAATTAGVAPATVAATPASVAPPERAPAPAVVAPSAPPPQTLAARESPSVHRVIDETAGQVVSVTPIQTRAPTSGVGAVGGAVVGGLLGNQVGHGHGRQLATIAGALGGGLAGNSVEGHVRTQTRYSVRVHMDSGAYRTFEYPSAPAVGVGDRVHVEHGALSAG
jgi:outer membrane lipoprotein SlyB